MKLRSNSVFNRGKSKVSSLVKNETFSERRLSLRSSRLNSGKGEIVSCVDDGDENLEMGMKEGLNGDDKGVFLGSEVVDPVEDSVVSCPKEEIEEEGNESVSISLSETGVGFKDEVKSPHVECENGSKSLELQTFADDTMIVNGDVDKETSLDDQENPDILRKCKEMKENGKRGRKKKNVGKFKKIESSQEKIDVNGVNVNESDSINLSETGLGFKDEVKSPHVECENGSKSLELETFADGTMIVYGDVDKETSLDDQENPDILGQRREMKEKGKRGRKKKNAGWFKKIERNQEKIDVIGVNGGDDECTLMLLKSKREKKRKNVEGSSSEYNGRTTNEKVEKNGAAVTVDGQCRAMVLVLKQSDEIPIKMLTEGENVRPKKKLKSEKPCKLQGPASGGGVAMVNGGLRAVVLGLKRSEDIPNMRPKKKLKRRERPCKLQGEIMSLSLNDIPRKKLERRGRPRKVSREIMPLPLNEVPRKKLERRGRPRKVSGEITSLPLNGIPKKKLERRGRPRNVSREIISLPLYDEGTDLKKFKRRGRPPKIEARTLALMSVEKRPKICKNVRFEEKSEFLNAEKGIIGGKVDRKQLKQLISDKILNVLLKCGWTIDHKQRQEKTYKDALYIEPNGKRTYWSITGAYAKLKWKIEKGAADNNEMSAFTPIPEEEISVLFRQRRKERKKKNNKILKNVKKGKAATNKKKKHGKKSKDGSKRKMVFKPRGSKQDNEGVLVIKKRNLLSWMVDSGVILAGTKVQYGKTRRQKRSSEGVITSDGICCGCCNETMGITRFVGHCGGKFGQDLDNLYLESGVCLRKCLIDSWRKEEESDVNRFNGVDIQGDDPNDDTCNICGDGGNLICCDGCPSTFHQSCLDAENFPSGDWNCIYCTCKFCGVVSVSTPQAEDSCGEVTLQMLSCCLCEEKFHQLCLQEVEDVNKDSNGLPFCGSKCQELFERLQTYIGVKHELEDGFSWTLLQRSKVDKDFNVPDTQLRVEHNSKLAVAFSVMDECFVPIVDERSGTSIIRNVVYNCGSNFKRLNYAGFLTAVLEKDDEFITAASIRIHGYQLAEMPFIGTRHIYRRQGMCRRLLDAIESTLSSLGVEELIIPAIPTLLQTWTDVFGFMPLEDTKKQAMKCMSMMVFPGIDMLKKPLSTGVGKDGIDLEQKEETLLLMYGCSSPKPDDENNPQVETTSSNATDCKQTSADTAGVVKDIIDYQYSEKETVLMDCCSNPDLENGNLAISNGVNNLCDLNLPAENVLPCDIDGQTSVDSESIEPSSFESVICGNPELPELKLDVEDDGVNGVKVKPSQLTSKLVIKNTFDLNLQPTAMETDVHIVSDDSVQCESQACIKSFELSDSRSQVDLSAGGQTDSKTCESQPIVIR